MLVLMMRRRNNKLLLAAGFCVSFLLGTLMNVLYIPAFEPGVRGGPQGVRFYGGRLSEEEAWKSASPPDRPKPGAAAAAARLAELRLQIQARYDEVLRYRSSSADNRPGSSVTRPDQERDSTDDDDLLLLLLLPQERQRRLMDLRDRHHRRNPRFHHRSPPAEYPSSEPSNNRTVGGGGGGQGGGRTEGGAGGTRFEAESVSVRLSAERHQRRRRVNPGDRDAFSHALTGTPATPATDCGGLEVDLTAARYLGSGYTKAVHRAVAMMATVNGTTAVPVALKSVDRGGHDMQNCVRRFGSGSEAACHRLASLKIIKETSLMERLQHPNVLRLHGVCYQSNGVLGQTVTAVTELGTPLDMITLLQSPWETRFKMCMGLVRLLHHLAHSPLGSVALLDFRPRQFVLVGAVLKVSDLDDATADTPLCYPQSPAAACRLEFPARNFSLPCTRGRCEAINEKRNLYNAYRFFFTYLLPHSAPPGLRPLLDNIVNATSELLWGVDQTLEHMDRVLHSYTNGLYLDNHTHTAAYRPVPGQAIQGDDYRCWPSYRHDACQLSVISLREAGLICDSHAHCRAFVLTNESTWTGRQLVYFKMGGAKLSPAQRWTSYIRVGI